MANIFSIMVFLGKCWENNHVNQLPFPDKNSKKILFDLLLNFIGISSYLQYSTLLASSYLQRVSKDTWHCDHNGKIMNNRRECYKCIQLNNSLQHMTFDFEKWIHDSRENVCFNEKFIKIKNIFIKLDEV